jgi:hypothetical protein
LLACVFLAMALAACGPRNMKQRLAHGEKRTDEATVVLNEAEQDLQHQNVDVAERKLSQAKELLADPDVELSAEGEMLRNQLADLTARLPKVREEKARQEREAREEKARQELLAAVDKQRDSVVQAMDTLTTALVALERTDAGRAQVDAVLDAVKQVRERQAAGKALEARSEDYAASARSTSRKLEQAEAKAKLVQRIVDFVTGPLAGSRAAVALEKKAQKERDVVARLALYNDVRERYRLCKEGAEKLMTESPELARRPIEAPGKPTTLKAVASSCGAKVTALQRTVAKLEKQAKTAPKRKASARKE